MKKYILVLVCLLSLNVSKIVAQGFDGKGNVMWNLGVAFWGGGRGDYFDYLIDRGGYGSKVELPIFVTALEFGIHDYVSIGPYLTYQHRSVNGLGRVDHLRFSEWTVRESWWNVGVKSAFHFTPFLNDKARTNIPEQLDLYAGLFLGMSIYHKNRIDRPAGVNFPVTSAAPSAAFLVAGARYFFTPGFGAFLELTPLEYRYHILATGFTVNF